MQWGSNWPVKVRTMYSTGRSILLLLLPVQLYYSRIHVVWLKWMIFRLAAAEKQPPSKQVIAQPAMMVAVAEAAAADAAPGPPGTLRCG